VSSSELRNLKNLILVFLEGMSQEVRYLDMIIHMSFLSLLSSPLLHTITHFSVSYVRDTKLISLIPDLHFPSLSTELWGVLC
jgi:hypothetical protein